MDEFDERERRLARANAKRSTKRCPPHINKRVEGNKVYCLGCGKVVGLWRDRAATRVAPLVDFAQAQTDWQSEVLSALDAAKTAAPPIRNRRRRPVAGRDGLKPRQTETNLWLWG